MTIRGPSKAELQELEDLISFSADRAPPDNVRFHALYGHESSLVAREYPVYLRDARGRCVKHVDEDGRVCLTVVGKKRLPMRRRQWIEHFCMIRAKNNELQRLVLNPPQRRLECAILRMQRAGLPVRIIILKARQMGFSTYIEAAAFESVVRGKRARALVVAHDDETATEVLQMAHTMRDEIPRKGRKWNFGMKHTATYHMAWDAPILGQIKIASAKKKNPGRGFTMSFLHLSETAFWDDAKKKARSLMASLAKIPGTMCIMESTADGAIGYFHDMFRTAWAEKELGKPLRKRATGWDSLFFAWFEMPDYHWTRTVGQGLELPDDIQLEILNSLTSEEEWLLDQTWFKRWSPDDPWEEHEVVGENGEFVKVWRRVGCGRTRVSLDQLAWRRLQIRDEFSGDPLRPETWADFDAEYPSTIDRAFQATGRLLFASSYIQEAMTKVREPVFCGTLVDLAGGPGDNVLDPDQPLEDFVEEKRRNVIEADEGMPLPTWTPAL